MEPLSAFVTTYNNDATLDACLASVSWADEILVLDSFSTDRTLEIARAHGAVIHQHEFMGYGPQKQHAMELTANRWVLLLDADEMVSAALAGEIQAALATAPTVAGFEFPRNEQVFWRMNDRRVRHNHYLRLLDKSRAAFSAMRVHAAPEVDGPVARLAAPFHHFGERDLHMKVEKVNHYSTGLVADKVAKGRAPNPWLMVIYPPLAFIRAFVFKRGFADGWAGFMSSATMAFYAFLKYAKLYEHARIERHGTQLLPPGAPAWRNRYLEPEARAAKSPPED